MTDFYPFFVIMFAAIFFSMVFGRVKVPWVVALIVGGMVIGPNGFALIGSNGTLEFLGQIGLIFLMFMAGLESDLKSFRGTTKKLFFLSFINAAIPAAVGALIGWYFGYDSVSIIALSIIFIASSIAVVIPSLERYNLLQTELGQAVVMTSVIQDVASLLFLSLLVQNIVPVTSLPLYLFYPTVFATLFLFRLLLPFLKNYFTNHSKSQSERFQEELRVLFVLLLGTVIFFEALGLHPIIAGFFAGLVLSHSITSAPLKEKIRTIAYGVFVPTFFVVVGMETDISVVTDVSLALPLILIMLLGSMLSKFLSGWFGGIMVGYTRDEALLFGVSSIPLLSTTLAIAFTARTYGFIDEVLLTAMILLSTVSTVVGPILMNVFGNRIMRTKGARTPTSN